MDLNKRKQGLSLRPPSAMDGAALHRLVGSCPPLDENSMYCNLLQCTHFSNTSVVAESSGILIGAVTGHLIPTRQDTLFIWQVAVAESARGQALGQRMLSHILARPLCANVTHLETTVTDANAASWAMFNGLAQRLNCDLHRSALFDRSTHFGGEHETEVLARIGPLPDLAQRQSATVVTDQQREKLA